MNTITSIWAKSSKAKEWLKRNLELEDYQFMGEMIIIETNYLPGILRGLKEANLKYKKDFLYQ